MEKLNSKHKQTIKLKNITKEEDITEIKRLLQEAQNVAMGLSHFDLIFSTAKTRADYLLLIGEEEFNLALKLYNCIKIYCTMMTRNKEKIFILEQIGYVYRLIQQHKKAVEVFKLMLQLAWILNDKDMEMKVFWHLGIEYYYLGDRKKSRYYNQRYHLGEFEQETSIIKQIYLQDFRINKKKY